MINKKGKTLVYRTQCTVNKVLYLILFNKLFLE